MKLSTHTFGVFITICFASLALSGCGSKTETTPESSSSALPGFIKIKDATRGVPEGTKIYSADGTLFGTIRAYDANHTFPNGEVGIGMHVELANNGPTLWMNNQVLSATKYMKP